MISIIYINECESTNDEIEKYILSKNLDLFSIYTFHQTKGKGQYGNSWETAENLNLAFTIAIREELINIRNILFNFHTADLLADFFANLTQEKVEIKYPNDLIIKNKKIGGILMEKKKIGESFYFVVGIGINVLQKEFKNLPKAGSLWTQTGKIFHLKTLAENLHIFLKNNLTLETSHEKIIKKLNNNLFRKDLVSVFEIQSIRQNGIIKKVDEDGFLWVELENEGLRKFYHKEIELLY